jgi:rRNA maturation protein Rpf1
MTAQFRKQFADGQGHVFAVREVVDTPAGLTVYYFNQETGQEYSCLIDAFTERFQEIQNDRR